MPSIFSRKRTADQQRDLFSRTNGDLLVNDDGPSGMELVYWMGMDSGGGSTPIGPNGPYPGSYAAAPMVTRATALITAPLTAAPFKVVDAAVPGKVIPTPRWLSDPMLARPDDRFGAAASSAVLTVTRGKFWTEVLRAAIWYGHGAFIAEEDAQGQPLAGTLKVVNPLLLSTRRDRDNALRWVIGAGARPEDRVVFDRDGRLTLGTRVYRLHVLRNPLSPIDDEGRSQGVFEMAPDVFRLGRQISEYTSGTFRQGIPAGYLKVSSPHLSQTAADELKKKWMDAHGGDRRSIAVLNATTEFTPLNLSPVDAALAEVKKLNVTDAAFAFGLDPMTLGAVMSGSGTYTNLRDAWQNHRDFGLAQWIRDLQDLLSSLLPGTQAVRVDLDLFANPTPAERYAAYKLAIDLGILTIAEVRALEGLPPLEEPPEPVEPPVDPAADLPDDDSARHLHIATH